jgi:hypothetical protein
MTPEIREQIHSRIIAGEAGQWDAAVLWQEIEAPTPVDPAYLGKSQSFKCGSCGWPLGQSNVQYWCLFCPHCGRSIKWV